LSNGKEIGHISGTYKDDSFHTYECWYVQILKESRWKFFVVNTEDNRISLEFFTEELRASRIFESYKKRYKGEQNGSSNKVGGDAVSPIGKRVRDSGSSSKGSDSKDDWGGTGNLF
jgi:hypothetical protein